MSQGIDAPLAPSSSHPLPVLPPHLPDLGQHGSEGLANKDPVRAQNLIWAGIGAGCHAAVGQLALQHLTGPVPRPGLSHVQAFYEKGWT